MGKGRTYSCIWIVIYTIYTVYIIYTDLHKTCIHHINNSSEWHMILICHLSIKINFPFHTVYQPHSSASIHQFCRFFMSSIHVLYMKAQYMDHQIEITYTVVRLLVFVLYVLYITEYLYLWKACKHSTYEIIHGVCF